MSKIVQFISDLTPKEQQVVKGLAEGINPKELAGQLGISATTLQTHRQNIYAKSGVGSWIELLHKFYEVSERRAVAAASGVHE